MAIDVTLNNKANGTKADSDWQVLEASEVFEFEFQKDADGGKQRRHRPVATVVTMREVSGIIDAEADATLTNYSYPQTGEYTRFHMSGFQMGPFPLTLSGSYSSATWYLISDGLYQKGGGAMAMEQRQEWQAVGAWSDYVNDEAAGA